MIASQSAMSPLMKKLLFLLLLCAASSAMASPKVQRNYQAMYDGCLGSYGYVNNGSVASCAQRVAGVAETEVNDLHKRLMDRFSAEREDRDGQQNSQKSWAMYRDSQCRLAGSHVGSPMYETCPMEMNIRRVEELRELLGE